MPTLTIGQFSLVYNMLSFALAAMLGSLIFFLFAREQVALKYRLALVISAVVVTVAGYHYWRIIDSWDAAYLLQDGMYVASGVPFNDAYRYVDWLLTVPLLVAELVAVLALSRDKSLNLTFKLALGAALMVILGYPGEVSTTPGARAMWGALSTIPFLYVVYVLWVELGKAAGSQTAEVSVLLRNTKLLLLASWGFYPIVFMLPLFGIAGATALVGVQVGYSIADVVAKCGYGLLIFAIAGAKSRADAEAQSAVAAQSIAAAMEGNVRDTVAREQVFAK